MSFFFNPFADSYTNTINDLKAEEERNKQSKL
jgi:hypothetical protein